MENTEAVLTTPQIETMTELEIPIEEQTEIVNETIDHFTRPTLKLFEQYDKDTIIQLSVFALAFFVVFGLIYRRCKNVKAKSMLSLTVKEGEGSGHNSSKIDMENQNRTVYLPMAGDRQSAKKAAKAKTPTAYAPNFMKNFEQFMEAGYSSYDSEAELDDRKSSKKERLI